MELEPPAASGLNQVGDDRLECGKGGPEEGENQAPGREVVISVGPEGEESSGQKREARGAGRAGRRRTQTRRLLSRAKERGSWCR